MIIETSDTKRYYGSRGRSVSQLTVKEVDLSAVFDDSSKKSCEVQEHEWQVVGPRHNILPSHREVAGGDDNFSITPTEIPYSSRVITVRFKNGVTHEDDRETGYTKRLN